MGTLCMGMMHVMAAQCDDFLVTMYSRFVIFVAVVPQKSFHQPRFGVMRIYVEDSIEKNFGDFPSFL